ncbi:protein SAR DEFICIENT 4-like [Salvia hispanica]|uniref:protein SAR DEFICIENT 4-like n=1 Tax=Salvia hispanica TaxID=49212 RepID=UPI00200915FF|nr:protein SAR DEFICIENT 4-like [Salvia hispanica]
MEKTKAVHLKSTLSPFSAAIESPLRHAHQITPNSSFILMPSWSTSCLLPYIGTKLVTHNPKNSTQNLPAYLSREDAEILVMVGAGSTAPHLIKAHLSLSRRREMFKHLRKKFGRKKFGRNIDD